MKLLVDTDAFCKLGIAGLLDPAVNTLVADGACARLPALPHMLKRGSLVRNYGAEACAALIPKAEGMAVAPVAPDEWLAPLVSIPSIDVGEAQLLALAAHESFLLMSGDKRALRAVHELPAFAEALDRRVVILEAILLELCNQLGEERVRHAVQPLTSSDTTIKICFSEGNPNPEAALASYVDALEAEVHPLILWKPGS